jgi:uncharacterized protein YndB with AHSA1/START domain
MSAPPEVVFNTATDPARAAAWLPAPLGRDGRAPDQARRDGGTPDQLAGVLRARWRTAAPPSWSARLQVRPTTAGGATVRLVLEAEPPDQRLAQIADESLDSLAREVADNLTAG